MNNIEARKILESKGFVFIKNSNKPFIKYLIEMGSIPVGCTCVSIYETKDNKIRFKKTKECFYERRTVNYTILNPDFFNKFSRRCYTCEIDEILRRCTEIPDLDRLNVWDIGSIIFKPFRYTIKLNEYK